MSTIAAGVTSRARARSPSSSAPQDAHVHVNAHTPAQAAVASDDSSGKVGPRPPARTSIRIPLFVGILAIAGVTRLMHTARGTSIFDIFDTTPRAVLRDMGSTGHEHTWPEPITLVSAAAAAPSRGSESEDEHIERIAARVAARVLQDTGMADAADGRRPASDRKRNRAQRADVTAPPRADVNAEVSTGRRTRDVHSEDGSTITAEGVLQQGWQGGRIPVPRGERRVRVSKPALRG